MKKPYNPPTITVEDFQLDQPIALACEADFDDVKSLLNLGYFAAELQCSKPIDDNTNLPYDTICYHSNIHKAFLS